MDVQRVFGGFREQAVHFRIGAQINLRRGLVRRIKQVVGRKKGEKAAGDLDGVRVVVGHEMNVAADAGVGRGAADFIHRAFLAGDGLNHFRPADEHVGAALDHDDEIHQGRRIGRAARARPGHNGNLRHDAGKQDVAKKHLAVGGERVERLPECARRPNR